MTDIVQDCKNNRHCPECQEASDEIERLRNLQERLTISNVGLKDTVRIQCEEIERLRADSERLVWLIESIRGADLYRICYPYLHNPETVGNVIAAIDAARGKRKP